MVTQIEIVWAALAWWASGCFGSYLTLWFWWRDDHDLTTAELPFALFASLLGVINLGVGLIFLSDFLFARLRKNPRVIARRRQ